MQSQRLRAHGVQHVDRVPRPEFALYFSLILIVAVPFALVGWVMSLVRERRIPECGPFARAWREAGEITPEIFRP